MRNIKKILLIFTLIEIFFFLSNCQKPKFDNPCDLNSDSHRNTNIVKYITSDSSSFCGIIPSFGSVATPIFTPSAGNKTSLSDINILTSTFGATIYYTTDGTNPTIGSNRYSSALENIWSLAGKTIKAFAVKNGMTDSAILSGVFSYPPLKTGQQTSYAVGDDGESQTGVSRSYTDNGDGTVKDNATGLIWQKCSMGLNNDAGCTGTASNPNWADAGTYCSGLSLGSKTWRLPSRLELETLSHFSGPIIAIAIDSSYFPNTTTNPYWSSSNYVPSSTEAWYINFSAGEISKDSKAVFYYVRCVSGTVKEYGNNLTENGDGTVKDNVTGLIWQKCSNGQSGSNCSGAASSDLWANALSACSGLSLAGKSWRLPNINELKSIIDINKSSGETIDTNIFPNTASGSYWSSTTLVSNTNFSWEVNFSSGFSVSDDTNLQYSYIRCVSGP
ncbi:MAG: DUF1566 domain-containing protein [Leptospiraceae bacterium]|nr:DUF1566 domain-containing protein [Leptospiraceae bacterium]MCK6381034.1 DUF1566 domain-containing protein [Leptospiraceae bacterium]NUM80371.1 DUF1566 domain-containing protein [bacterium]